MLGFLALPRQLLRRLLGGLLACQLGGSLLGLESLEGFAGLRLSGLGQLVGLELRPRSLHARPQLVLRRCGGLAVALGLQLVAFAQCLPHIARQVDDAPVERLPLAFQLAQRLGAGQPLGGFLLLLDALRARLAGAPLVAVGLRPKVLRRLGLDAALGVAPVVDAGLVAVPFKRGIRQLAPPRPLPVGHVLDLGQPENQAATKTPRVFGRNFWRSML